MLVLVVEGTNVDTRGNVLVARPILTSIQNVPILASYNGTVYVMVGVCVV